MSFVSRYGETTQVTTSWQKDIHLIIIEVGEVHMFGQFRSVDGKGFENALFKSLRLQIKTDENG